MEATGHKRPTEIEVCKSYRLTRDPIYRRFSRDMIAAMLVDENKLLFVRPPEVVLFFIVLGVSRGWLKRTNYNFLYAI